MTRDLKEEDLEELTEKLYEQDDERYTRRRDDEILNDRNQN